MQQVDPKTTEKQEYERFLKALGAQIRAMRKERGWTLRDMVVQHGFHLSAWQGYEAGRLGMSLPSLLRVANALDLQASALLALVERGAPLSQSAPAAVAKTPARVTPKRPTGTKQG